jgi:hypothetical protein
LMLRYNKLLLVKKRLRLDYKYLNIVSNSLLDLFITLTIDITQ